MDYHNLFSIVLNDRLQNDLELILNGGLDPLQGFMTEKEYNSVLEKSELPNGSVFTLPINLYINDVEYNKIQNQEQKSIVLKDEQGFSLAILDIEDIYKPDLDKDGVPDVIDKCPLRGDEGNGVDKNGCPIQPMLQREPFGRSVVEILHERIRL